jgi:hypothetical protein
VNICVVWLFYLISFAGEVIGKVFVARTIVDGAPEDSIKFLRAVFGGGSLRKYGVNAQLPGLQ